MLFRSEDPGAEAGDPRQSEHPQAQAANRPGRHLGQAQAQALQEMAKSTNITTNSLLLLIYMIEERYFLLF